MLPQPVLAKIHIGKKELNLDDLIYRDILRINTGKESAKDLSLGEANKILAHFKELGWEPKSARYPPSVRKGGKRKYDDFGIRSGMATPKQLRLIEVTWANNPNVREKSPEALRRFIERRFKVSDLRFVEDRDVGKVLMAIKSIKPGLSSPQNH